jgi:hypothetical protein
VPAREGNEEEEDTPSALDEDEDES